MTIDELKALIAQERARMEYDLPLHTSAPAIQRFAAKILIAPLNDCWLWTGSKSKIG